MYLVDLDPESVDEGYDFDGEESEPTTYAEAIGLDEFDVFEDR